MEKIILIIQKIIKYFLQFINLAYKNQKLIKNITIETTNKINYNNLIAENSIDDYFTIPNKQENNLSGSNFIDIILNVSGQKREDLIFDQFKIGNIPDFMRNKIEMNIGNITYFVMPDYLCIGNNDDYFIIPMWPTTAQKIADLYNCFLPTKKIVDDIWKYSDVKLEPIPNGPPYTEDIMGSSKTFYEHNKKITINQKDIGKLISGHKKDIILTNKLYPNNPNKRVAIYGWHKKTGAVIQPVNAISHSINYSDYSHGVRLVSKIILVNNKKTDCDKVFDNDDICKYINEDGILKFKKY